ncbi:STAS domain-containing protein [Jannaschia sp. CCS1]|uniref:STAS domain-containing protein n=1 Tax=Jannaschia sp. (strain CCS1) TaxID=290400 RepID=UPI000053BBFF|nr:STAS domain-containing protein [Jannaschia sp. CCS1]ABD56968.1 anti-sigma-factor antagonist (STAS) domain protein [Jannaschia sp. CCS1]
MNLTYTPHITVGVVHLADSRLDASIAIQFKETFRTLTADGGDVILDLTDVEFLDSSGLGAIVAVYKGLGPGRHMALAGLQPPVEKVMTLTRMNAVFAIFPTLDAGLAAIGPTAAE